MLVEHPRVDRGALLVGAGVELGAHAVEQLVDLGGRVALGAAEQQVLEEVREAGLRHRLTARAGGDEEAQGRGPHGGHGLRDDPQPGVELRDAMAGDRRLSRRSGSRSPRGARSRSRPRPPRSPPPRPPRWPRPRSRRALRAATRGRAPPPPGHRGSPVPTVASSSLVLPAMSGSSARRRPMRPRSLSTSTTRTAISSPLLSTSSTVPTRLPGETLEMCSRPSVPLASSTNAPNVVVLTTLPRELVADLDLLGHRADALDQGVALGAGDGVDEDLALVVDVDLGLVLLLQRADRLAALADQQADLLRIDLDRADPRRVLGELLARGADRLGHLAEDERRGPPWPASSASRMISNVTPVILMSICRAVMPFSVPATLKSMSPRWSSTPAMSERTT